MPRALVVDDEPMILRYVKRALEQLGLDLRATDSPRQALEWLQESHWDVLVTDVQMPGMSGLRARPRSASCSSRSTDRGDERILQRRRPGL